MKKFLLFAAAFAAMTLSAQNYTFEKVWEVNANLPTNADSRQGISINGTYFINVKTLVTNEEGEVVTAPSIVAVDKDGIIPTGLAGGTNCGITRDEAGNLVISLASFPNGWVCDGETPMIRVINPQTDETKEYAIPEGAAVTGRADFLGLAQGNLMETGKLFMVGANNAGIVILNIVDGEVDVDNSYEATCDPAPTPSTATVVNNIDGERIFYVTRNAPPVIYSPDGDNFAGETVTLPNKGAACGAQVFKFDGKDFAVYPTLPNYQDGFAVAEVGAEEPLFVNEPTGLTAYAQCNWLNAEVIDGEVFIYQYLPGLFVACYKMSTPPVEHTYAVTGTPAALFGLENEWDATAAPEMALNENGLYEWTSEETALEVGNIEFKVVQDHGWDVCFPVSDENGYNNFTVPVEEAGTYVLNVLFNPETKEINAVLTPPENPAKVYILGEVNGNTWATNVGVEMETQDNTIFTADVVLKRPDTKAETKYCYFSFATKLMEAADDWDGLAPYRFGAVSEGDFLVEPEMLGQPLALTSENGQAFQVPEGEYTLTVDLEHKTLTIEGTIYSGIKDITTMNLKSVRFYNLQGMESATPFQGVNIVVSEMTDGSKVITKVVK